MRVPLFNRRRRVGGVIHSSHHAPLRPRPKRKQLIRSFYVFLLLFAVYETSLLAGNTLFRYFCSNVDGMSAFLLERQSQSNLYQLGEWVANVEGHKVSHSLEDKLEAFVSEYRAVVAQAVDFQTGSWFRYLGAYRVQEEEEHKKVTTRKLQSKQQRRSNNSYNKTKDGLTGQIIQWDDEGDIPNYFDRLISSCRKVNVSSDIYAQLCLFFLHGLVNKPRCTVRLDSRTTCRRRDIDDDSLDEQVPLESILGPDQHFSANTINVVILGGGPAGLYLANALTQIPILKEKRKQQKSDDKFDDDNDEDDDAFPAIRIVVFENRLLAEGHKKPYSRLWMTGITIGKAGTIDPRVHEFFGTLVRGAISLPINVWETLLLLSCRDLGVKFIFGDVSDYEQNLLEVPNLVMFDATGHRLQPLQRLGASNNNNPHHQEETTTVYGWKGDSEEMRKKVRRRWRFPAQWLEPPPAATPTAGKDPPRQLEIALQQTEAGPLLYPVLPNHKAYFTYRFDFSNLRYDDMALNKLRSIEARAYQRFQDEQQVKPPFQGSPVVDYNDDVSLRPKVLNHIKANKFAGIEISGYSIKPTEDQGIFLEQLLRRHAKPGESSIPWSRISVEEYQGNPVLETNDVEGLLKIASKMSQKYDIPGERGASASAYRSRPYMYKDPVIPGGYNLCGQRRVPLLRVGNSLFSGDTDISSGLGPQLQQIRHLQCRVLGLNDGERKGCS